MSRESTAYAAELDVAREAARAAGKLLLEQFRTGIRAELKGDRDIVTAADRASEELVRRIIHEAFPTDLVVGEEGEPVPEARARGRRRWYVDPLDGTTNYVKGQRRWAVSVAFCDDDDSLGACAIYRPCVDEESIATRGGGAWLDDRRLVRDDDLDLDDAMVLLGPMAEERLPTVLELSRRALSLRITGSTVSDLADLAAGRAELHLGMRQGRWDVAAGILLAQEAGLTVTDMAGRTLTGPADNVVIGTPRVHGIALALLDRNGARRQHIADHERDR